MENVSYVLRFDANGGESAPETVVKNGNENYAIFRVTESTPSRDGFVFSGWSFNPNGEAIIHSGDYFTAVSTDITLYAIWVRQDTIVSTADSSDGNVEPLGVVEQSGSQQVSFMNYGMLSFFGFGIVLGVVLLFIIHRREPRIVSIIEE